MLVLSSSVFTHVFEKFNMHLESSESAALLLKNIVLDEGLFHHQCFHMCFKNSIFVLNLLNLEILCNITLHLDNLFFSHHCFHLYHPNSSFGLNCLNLMSSWNKSFLWEIDFVITSFCICVLIIQESSWISWCCWVLWRN
jgi:hypothetical protein